MESNNTVNHEALGYFSDAKFFEYPVTPKMENLADIQSYLFLEHVFSLDKIKDQLSDYSREFHESIAFEKSGSVPNEQVIREALEDCVREIVFDEHNECDDMIEVGGFYFDGESFFQVMGSLLRGLMNSWWTKYALCQGVAFLGGDDDIQALSMVVGLDNSLIGHAWSMVDSDFPDEIIRSEGERIWTPSPESVINIIRDAVAATDWCGHDVSITHEPNKLAYSFTPSP